MRVTHDRVAEGSYQTTKAGLDLRFYVLFSAIILISALACRLIQLQNRSLWLDETDSYWFATRRAAVREVGILFLQRLSQKGKISKVCIFSGLINQGFTKLHGFYFCLLRQPLQGEEQSTISPLPGFGYIAEFSERYFDIGCKWKASARTFSTSRTRCASVLA